MQLALQQQHISEEVPVAGGVPIRLRGEVALLSRNVVIQARFSTRITPHPYSPNPASLKPETLRQAAAGAHDHCLIPIREQFYQE